MDLKKFIYVFSDSEIEWNCSQWRALSPSNSLNRTKKAVSRCIYIKDFVQFGRPDVLELCGLADYIMVERNLLGPDVWAACDFFRGLGKTVLAQLDDAFTIIDITNPAWWFWKSNRAGLPMDPLVALEEGLCHVDGLISPSKVILEDWAHIVPGYWIPNFVDDEFYRDLPPRDNQGRIVIGYGCSVSHYLSWMGSGVREALVKVVQEHPEVLVRVHGNDRRLYDMLAVPHANKQWVPGVPPAEWPKMVSQFDIGLAPLFGDYDQRRSWLKVAEYLCAKVPWVASEGRPYEDLVKSPSGIIVDDWGGDIDAWYHALKKAVEKLPWLREKADTEGWELAKKLFLNANADYVLGVWEKASMVRRDAVLPGIGYINWGGITGNAVPEIITS